MRRILMLVLLVVGLGLTTAMADSTLHIGSGQGTACATGGCGIFGGEVNATTGTFDIFQQSNGAPALNSPVLLILGVPNNKVSLGAGNITGVQLFTPYTASSGTSVGSSFVGFEGLMGAGQNVYSFLNLTGNNSNSFTNWSAADLAVNGVNATDFGIYVFALNTGSFAGNDLLNIMTTGVPRGTFIVAWGDSVNKKGKTTAWGTPFTEAGVNTSPSTVPEPATLTLLGAGLAGVVGAMRRRKLGLKK